MFAPAGDDNFWPYTPAEAKAIRDSLPVEKRRALDLVIFSARVYAAMHQRDRKKSNPQQEVLRLAVALKEFDSALCGLSSEALVHLKRHQRHGRAFDRPLEREDVLAVLNRLKYENTPGFTEQAPRPGAGRPPDYLVQSFTAKLSEAWVIGNGGVTPRTGWPEFQALCLDPLVRMKLIGDATEKGRQKIRTKARRRNSP
jgi:hypothetical protein